MATVVSRFAVPLFVVEVSQKLMAPPSFRMRQSKSVRRSAKRIPRVANSRTSGRLGSDANGRNRAIIFGSVNGKTATRVTPARRALSECRMGMSFGSTAGGPVLLIAQRAPANVDCGGSCDSCDFRTERLVVCPGPSVAVLEDGTPDGWAPGPAGVPACEAKCKGSAICGQFKWNSTAARCFWHETPPAVAPGAADSAVMWYTQASCADGLQNGDEADVDCGGSCASCASCSDGVRNGDELGIDCGGLCAPACATCSDGIRNGDEANVDCGGSCDTCDFRMEPLVGCAGPRVAVLEDGTPDGWAPGLAGAPACEAKCKGSAICGQFQWNWRAARCFWHETSSLAASGAADSAVTCYTRASCTDGVHNGDETDADCGGSCGPCASCSDGVRNGDEPGVDCGGCCAAVCPTCNDGVRNGDEANVDCGGSCLLPGGLGGTVTSGWTLRWIVPVPV